MFNKKKLSIVACLLPIITMSDAFAHPGHHHDGHHHLLQFAAVGLASAAMLGGIYFMLVMIGKSNLKKNKGAIQ